MDKNATRYNVQLYIYDLSRGMARSLSPIMLGEYGPWNRYSLAWGTSNDNNKHQKDINVIHLHKHILPCAALSCCDIWPSSHFSVFFFVIEKKI